MRTKCIELMRFWRCIYYWYSSTNWSCFKPSSRWPCKLLLKVWATFLVWL